MSNQIKEKLWTESFVKICLVNFFIMVNFHALLPTFPYFIEYLGGDSIAMGLATALFSLSSIISRLFLGWLIDTKGRRIILIIGLVGMSLIPMGYFVAAGIAFAVILRNVHGVFHAAASSATSTWVTDIVPRSRMGEGLGMFGLSMAISTAVAPALGLAVMNWQGGLPTSFGFLSLFITAALAGVVALFIGISIKNRNYKQSETPFKINGMLEKKSIPASVTQFFFMITYGVIEVYVAIYATKNGLPSGGIYFLFIAVATILTRMFLGRVVDHRGEGILVYTGNIAVVIGVLLLVFVHNAPGYIVSALLLGYSFGAIQPSLQAMAMKVVAPDRRGAASSTFFIAFDLGIALGALLAGILIKHVGYDWMFICIGFSSVLSLAYYFLFGRNHESSLNNKRCLEESTDEVKELDSLPLVITISREYGSGGHDIGQLLAEKWGVNLYDSKLIEMTAKESGLSADFVKANEQKLQDNRLFDLYSDITEIIPGEDPTRLAMFYAQSKIIRDLADKESCVIVGRLANFILQGKANCFNVFIHADKPHRLERIVSEYGIDKENAEKELQRIDKERAEHCLHFTGKEWGASTYYDLSINSSLLGIKGTAEELYAIIIKINN